MNHKFYQTQNIMNGRTMWIWTSCDYSRRVLELLISDFDPGNHILIPAGTQIEFKVALFIFTGDFDKNDVQFYGLMFLDPQYTPSIEDVILP